MIRRLGNLFRLVVVWFVSSLSAPAAEPSAERPGDSDPFSNSPNRTIQLHLEEPALAALKQNPRVYVRARFADGAIVLKDVGLRLKGKSTFRPLEDKPSLILKFDQFQAAAEYSGLTRLVLNNSISDPSLLREFIAAGLFQDAGLPAPRAAHARVELNGRDLGFYVLLEAVNRRWLQRRFGNGDGNLYELELRDIDQPLEQDGGPDRDQRDVRALLSAARRRDPAQRWQRLGETLDVDRFLSFLALEMMLNHWDGYAMNLNNCRLYHDPQSDRFVFIPHGMDSVMTNPDASIWPPTRSILVRALWLAPEGRERYRQRVAHLYTNVFRLPILTNRVQESLARLSRAAGHPTEANQLSEHVTNLLNHLTQRAQSIAQQLSAGPPEPLAFDAEGRAHLTGWSRRQEWGELRMEQLLEEGKATLHLDANFGGGIGSWRTRVLLETGRYRLEGSAKTRRVFPFQDQAASGAALRISGAQPVRHLFGDKAWQTLQHDFAILDGPAEVELICELRAGRGEAWFDLDSLSIVRRGP
jgi:hypothetical protein